MNPGIGAPELLILLILALIVVGPKELPLMMRKVGRFLGQARGMARDFQRSFDELGREAEMAELKKEIDALKKSSPLGEVERELKGAEAEFRDAAADRPHPRVAPKKPVPMPDPAPPSAEAAPQPDPAAETAPLEDRTEAKAKDRA
ncbi:twin-arginine translocase subunit TatB [Glycocaulis profundi]|nr:twin-arginine translocase subunit TatB [Glycocaulis profundi]